MGFFSKLLRGLGIETEGSEKKKQDKQPADKYANFNMHETKTPQMDSYSNDVVNSLNFGTGMPNMIIQRPTSHKDVQKVADILRQGQAELIDLAGLDAQDSGRILDFLSGAIYALNGSIHRINADQFILMPAGSKILVQQQENTANPVTTK